MVAVLLVAMALVATSTSCQPAASSPRLGYFAADVDAELRAGCRLAEDRCARCHTLDRVAYAPVATPAQWQEQVARMRRMAGSAISRRDGDAIVRCLVYRSFGPAGLAALGDPPAAAKGSP